MKIDLEQALSDLARSVHDDGVTDRMTGQVRTMVGRIRRRRAARQTATGVVGLGAVAGLAVGATQLWDRTAPPVPPATDVPPEPVEPDITVGLDLVCGEAVPPAPPVPEHLTIGAAPLGTDVAFDDLFPVDLVLATTGTDPVRFDPATPIRYALLDDGVVVAHGDRVMDADPVEPGDTLRIDGELIPLEPCANPIEPGAYEMVALFTLVEAGVVTHTLLTDPWPITVAPDPGTSDVDAETAIADIIAASPRISAEYPFGTCGTRVPEGDERLLTIDLDLDLDLESSLYLANSGMEGTARITAVDGLTVLGNAPISAANVVLTRDGVVVGRGYYDPDGGDVDMLTFTPDDPYSLPVVGHTSLCGLPGADDPEVGLPPGVYQAYATLEVTLKEIQYPDGSAESRSDLVVARSEPVDVGIG